MPPVPFGGTGVSTQGLMIDRDGVSADTETPSNTQ
jgi:hypothetical protein